MTINERHMNWGDWSVELLPDTPQSVLDMFRVKDDETDGFLGHIIITPKEFEDTDEIDILAKARYAGVLRSYEFSTEQKVISGSGMVWWLGEQNDEGPGVSKTLEDYTGQSFTDALTNALAGSDIQPGNLTETGALPAGQYILKTCRYKVEHICSQYDSEYVVTPQGKLDAGTPASLFPSFNDPEVFIKRKATVADPVYKDLGLAEGHMGAEDHTLTEKYLVREQDEEITISGEATQSTSKRGINNSLVSRISVSAESDEDASTADSRAAALLELEGKTRKVSTLSTDTFDIDAGKLRIGHRVLVWAPDAGYMDRNNEREFGGEIYWPSKEVVIGLTWPLAINEDGSRPGVYFRETFDGALHNITDFIAWEADLSINPDDGVVDVEIASAPRSLAPKSDTPLGPITGPVTNPQTVPGVPDAPTVFGDERQLLVQAPTTTGGGNPQPQSMNKLNVYASTTSGFTADAASRIGYISISRSDISLGIDVVKRLPWPEDQQTYVRVAGANDNVEGPASAEVPVTAPLIPDAAILNLTASKITTGELTASVSVKTGELLIGGPDPKTWTAHVGTWGIDGNKAYRVSPGSTATNDYATLDTGESDVYLECEITTSASRTHNGIVFRVDPTGDNYHRVNMNTSQSLVQLARFDAGVGTILASIKHPVTASTTYKLSAFVKGDVMSVFVDDQVVASRLTGALAFGALTKHGIGGAFSSTNTTFDDGASRIDNFKAGVAADNFNRANSTSALGTTNSDSILVADGDGIRMADVSGVDTLFLRSASGTGVFGGVLDSAIFEGGSIVGAQVIGSLVGTAPTGNRIELGAPGNPDNMAFYTGETGEINPGIIQVFDSLIRITSPEFTQDDFAEIDLYGAGGPTGLSRAKVSITGGPVGASDIDLDIQATLTTIVAPSTGTIDLSRGSGGRLLLAASADLIFGDDWLRISNNSHSFVNSGTESLLVQDFQIVARRDLKMVGNRIYLDGLGSSSIRDNAGIPRWVHSSDSFVQLSSTTVELSANGQLQLQAAASTKLWVDDGVGGGGNATDIVAWIPAAGAFKRLQVGAADSLSTGRRLTWFPN